MRARPLRNARVPRAARIGAIAKLASQMIFGHTKNPPRGSVTVVPKGGLEPPRLTALPPQGSASTNSATWARCLNSQSSVAGFAAAGFRSLSPSSSLAAGAARCRAPAWRRAASEPAWRSRVAGAAGSPAMSLRRCRGRRGRLRRFGRRDAAHHAQIVCPACTAVAWLR